jgi:hypothetical protein
MLLFCELNYVIHNLRPGNDDMNQMSILILFFLSQAEFSLLKQFAAQLFKNGKFLEYCEAHIKRNTLIVRYVWSTVANVGSICHETKMIVMESPITRVHFPTLFNSQQDQVVVFCYLSMIINTGGRVLPELGFLKATWLPMIQKLVQINPTITREIDDFSPIARYILSSIHHISFMMQDQEELGKFFLIGEEKHNLITYLCQCLKNVPKFPKYTITPILYHALLTNPGRMAPVMFKNNCLSNMTVFCHDIDWKISTFAIRWMGVYATSSVEAARTVIEQDSLDPIVKTIRHSDDKRHEIISACIEVLVKLAEVCIERKNVEILEYLLSTKTNIIKYTAQYIKKEDYISTLRILTMWYHLLGYNKVYVLDRIGSAISKVEELNYSNDTEIHLIAKKIMDVYEKDRGVGGDYSESNDAVAMVFDF